MTNKRARAGRHVTLAAVLIVAGQAAHAADTTTPNLLINGDAESLQCTDDWTAQSPVPGWRVVRGAARVLCYSAFGYTQDTPVLPTSGQPGLALFAAPGIDSAMEQGVDVSAAADAIDRGGVHYTLSGWLGGWRDRPERATLTAVFLDRGGDATGQPVVIADAGPQARGGRTALVARSSRGTLPAGTRRIDVTVDFPSGMTSFDNAYADNLSLTLSGAVGSLTAATAVPPLSRVPPLDHVYVVMMENTNYADVVHSSGARPTIDRRMPFLASVATQGVLLTNSWATYHPSDQNYVAMVAGGTYEYGPVYYPNFDLTVTHLGDLLDAQGRSWRAYVQNMKTPCNLSIDPSGVGWYAPDDQPFAQFQDVIGDPVRCVRSLRDLSDFESAIATNTLPDFAWLAADGWWDGEGAWYQNYDVGYSLARQDQFLGSTLAPLLASDSWKSSRSLLIITWDESDGWGWPDNHVPTVLVGSPGLLRQGAAVATHYDGYGVLRTIESALGLPGLNRFDTYAQPLNDVFANAPHSAGEGLHAAEAAATRGTIADTFGRVATPTAVYADESLALLAPSTDAGDASIVLAPWGRVPEDDAARSAVDADGIASVSTAGLEPGRYGAWLVRGARPPAHAPLPVLVLPPPQVQAQAAGVEIVGAALEAGATGVEVREGGNVTVRYCRPANLTAAQAWVGVFPTGTPPDQMTQSNALAIGYWLKTPGESCGEAMAYASELTPSASYQILLFKNNADGTSTAIGSTASFTLTPALPH